MPNATYPDQPERDDEDQPVSLADVVGADLVPLSVGEVPILDTPDGPVVALRHAVTALGMSYPRVLRTIRARSWGSVAQRATVTRDGRRMQMVTVDVRTFIMWLATVDERRVPEGPTRDRVIAAQREAADVLYAYVTKGLAINPRGRTPEQIRLIEAAGEGLVGPVFEASADAYGALQYLEGRRDMPSGQSAASVTRRLYKAVRRVHEAVIDTGLDAVWALKRGEQ